MFQGNLMHRDFFYVLFQVEENYDGKQINCAKNDSSATKFLGRSRLPIDAVI
jgi:hypothetical protein